MSDKELQELQEFNHRVAEGAKKRDQFATPPAVSTDVKMPTQNASLWAISGQSYLPCEEAVKELPPGHYVVEHNNVRGVFLTRHELQVDELLELPDSESEKVIDEIEKFWTLEDHFRKYGFLWKRGILLWGPPGSGKTSTLQILSRKIIQSGGIAISVDNPIISSLGMHIVRRVEPKRPIIGLIEDIDAIIGVHGESSLLALLDGENQIDNVVFLATTNYPERLDPRFINRPSRFDVIKKIGMPSIEARALYLAAKSQKLREDKKELAKWVSNTDDFSVAHLKELIISVEVFGLTYEQSLNRLKTMMGCDANSTEYRELSLGFKSTGALSSDLTAESMEKILKNLPVDLPSPSLAPAARVHCQDILDTPEAVRIALELSAVSRTINWKTRRDYLASLRRYSDSRGSSGGK